MQREKTFCYFGMDSRVSIGAKRENGAQLKSIVEMDGQLSHSIEPSPIEIVMCVRHEKKTSPGINQGRFHRL